MPPARQPVPSRRPHDSDSTRNDLLSAATELFTLHGYEATPSREIAAKANANVSLINRYFGSKEGLFEAAIERAAKVLSERNAGSFDELLDGFVTRVPGEAWPEYGNQHPLLLLVRGSGSDARTARLRQRILAAVATSFAELLPEGTDHIERQARAEALLSLFAGVLVLRAAIPEGALSTVDDDTLRATIVRAAEAIARP